MGEQRRCAVLGSPIQHSLSPVLHRAAYRYLGLAWTYEALEVGTNDLQPFVVGLDAQWRGLSLTMPLKQAAVAVATDVVGVADTLGVANTLVLDGERRVAHNTDVTGMRAVVAEAGIDRVPVATVIGGGSTAAAAVAAVGGVADRVVVVLRSTRRAEPVLRAGARLGVPVTLAAWEDAAVHLGAPLIVSTTPAGATDAWVPLVPKHPGMLFDVVYDPWPTPLAQAWADAGAPVAGGLDLLVHQAVGQVALMTGEPVPAAVLRDALKGR